MSTPDLSPEEQLRTMVVAYGDALGGELEPTGPRAGADSGDPRTSTLVLFEGHGVSVGVWECTPGGWPIVDRSDTETMMLLRGAVTITPLGGEPVDLVEGDVFVLPRGWSGRWDVTETVRKLFVVAE
ncbi:MAG TPA: cupin domain-containing protein [Candidatus Angelobacter sp.]|nr:cupin domain-containing protein [Candidatus Angelobacter sp.]